MLNAYLKFNGTAEQAFNFYKAALNGEITGLHRFADTPHKDHLPAEDQQKIMHITLETKRGTLMGSDHIDAMGIPFREGNNFSLSIQANSETEANELFNKLSEGGTITMPIQKVFWGSYFGMCTDQFGIQWMINHQY